MFRKCDTAFIESLLIFYLVRRICYAYFSFNLKVEFVFKISKLWITSRQLKFKYYYSSFCSIIILGSWISDFKTTADSQAIAINFCCCGDWVFKSSIILIKHFWNYALSIRQVYKVDVRYIHSSKELCSHWRWRVDAARTEWILPESYWSAVGF